MGKYAFILSISLLFASCAAVYGPNLEKEVQRLDLGMTKQETINIMGKNYFVESVSQVEEGKLEVLFFRSTYYPSYLLYFIDGNLSEFHRYIPPTPYQQDVRIIKEKSDD
ncbi:DUF3192 domain-containing protein [Prevotella sp. 10(H)]|uniref:DUF3192 domain-containing protein n=1 Tax=Prevotella sp. 10(H) TaxID=1158294 RepID=UPI0004A702CB|nr:DUF3192 domain-containing protein [Prevotella sp. 10(H)]